MEIQHLNVKNDKSSLSFLIKEDNGTPWWHCVDLNGKPLYIVSNRCGTCPAIFNHVMGRDKALAGEQLSNLLNEGLESVSQQVLDKVEPLLPTGKYLVSLHRMSPRYSRISSREVKYHWVEKIDAKFENGLLSDTIYPIVPESKLNEDRITHYYYLPYTAPHLRPVALTLSFVMNRYPGGKGYQRYVGHILLDGHHKMMAASWRGAPISVLSFWVTDSFVSDLEEKSAKEFIQSIYIE